MANGPIGKPKSKMTRSTWAGVAPSSIIWSASMPRMNSMRLPTKPWHTPTSTGILSICLAMAIVVATTVSRRLAPRTTSSSFITLAGEKKCMPITLSGREVAAAISLTSRADVFDARMAPGLQIGSSSAKIDFFSSMSSNTASITMSQSAKSALSVEPVISAMRCSTASAGMTHEPPSVRSSCAPPRGPGRVRPGRARRS